MHIFSIDHVINLCLMLIGVLNSCNCKAKPWVLRSYITWLLIGSILYYDLYNIYWHAYISDLIIHGISLNMYIFSTKTIAAWCVDYIYIPIHYNYDKWIFHNFHSRWGTKELFIWLLLLVRGFFLEYNEKPNHVHVSLEFA